jgi:hypothetical protein
MSGLFSVAETPRRSQHRLGRTYMVRVRVRVLIRVRSQD